MTIVNHCQIKIVSRIAYQFWCRQYVRAGTCPTPEIPRRNSPEISRSFEKSADSVLIWCAIILHMIDYKRPSCPIAKHLNLNNKPWVNTVDQAWTIRPMAWELFIMKPCRFLLQYELSLSCVLFQAYISAIFFSKIVRYPWSGNQECPHPQSQRHTEALR